MNSRLLQPYEWPHSGNGVASNELFNQKIKTERQATVYINQWGYLSNFGPFQTDICYFVIKLKEVTNEQ